MKKKTIVEDQFKNIIYSLYLFYCVASKAIIGRRNPPKLRVKNAPNIFRNKSVVL
jgi:hypothetical protein